jgi:23S rRNA pseudouridine1911/1915/1917 synthase
MLADKALLLVDAAEDRPRLDAFLRRHLTGVSRREIQVAIARGLVTVNGRRAAKGDRVGPGDRVDATAVLALPPSAPAQLDIPTLYFDAEILALAKPAGIASTARRIGGRASVAGYLLHRMPELAAVAPSPLDAGLVHRLDTETSGVLLAARTAEAWRALREQFRRRAVDKEYVAVVRGCLRESRTLTHDLGHDRRRPGAMRVATRGSSLHTWAAAATVVPVAWTSHATRVRVRLHTGVTHQIRVQLAAIGHPILGDRLYEAPACHSPDRLLLHASRLRVVHPTSGMRVDLRAPLPQDFTAALEQLGFANRRRRAR